MYDFAKATGRRAKTDALDAHVLAHCNEAVRPPVRQLRDDETQELNAMTTHRNQAITMLVAEKNRLTRAVPPVVPASGSTSPGWSRSSRTWTTVYEKRCAAVQCGEKLNRKQIAALVGVAPINRDSGTMQGHRAVWAGRARVRTVLYMGALVASRRNPVMGDFCQRLWPPVSPRKRPSLRVCVSSWSSSTAFKSGQHWKPETVTS